MMLSVGLLLTNVLMLSVGLLLTKATGAFRFPNPGTGSFIAGDGAQWMGKSERKDFPQGQLGNNIIEPGSEVGQMGGDIHRKERLGGLLSYYYRDAV
jgi:hypothetical protein